MIDHFMIAEKLLADTAELDPTLPFVQQKVSRAGVHAQLATVQAFLNGCDCSLGDVFPLPWKPEVTVTAKEDFL